MEVHSEHHTLASPEGALPIHFKLSAKTGVAEETDTPSHFMISRANSQVPEVAASMADSFSQDSHQETSTFHLFPIPAFKTPRIHTLKRKNNRNHPFLLMNPFSTYTKHLLEA